jgi:hypothetical protein
MPISAEERRKAILAQKAAQNKKVLTDAGYVPDFSSAKTNSYFNTQPRVASDQAKFPEQPYGIQDPNWDYKTANASAEKLGPNGEQMMTSNSKYFSQKGWTPHGTPWYGGQNNLSEYFMSIPNKWNPKFAEKGGDLLAKASDQAYRALYGDDGKLDIGFQKTILGGLGAVGTSLEALGSIMFKEEGEGVVSTVATGFVGAISKALGVGIGLLAQGAGELAEDTEQIISIASETPKDVIRAGGGEVKEREQLPVPTEFFGFENNIFTGKPLSEDFKKLLGNSDNFIAGLFDTFNPVKHISNSIRSAKMILDGSVSLQEFGDIVEANRQAGRILYSTWIDPLTKVEYKKRLRRGEDPYLLAEELMNPVAELVGELIFDPLNALGFVKKAKSMTKNVDAFNAEMTKGNDVIAKALTSETMSDAEKITSIAEELGVQRKMVQQGLAELANQKNAKALTYTSKRIGITKLVGNRMGHLLDTVARYEVIDPKTGLKVIKYDAHKAAELNDAIYKLSDASDAVRMDAWTTLTSPKKGSLGMGIDPNIISSPATMKTSIMMRDIMEGSGLSKKIIGNTIKAVRTAEKSNIESLLKGAGFHEKTIQKVARLVAENKSMDDIIRVIKNSGADSFLAAVKENKTLKGLLEFIDPLAEKATKKMFPSLSDMAKSPEIYGELSATEKFLMGAEKIVESKFLKDVNTNLAYAYMGLSPGYVARNIITNSLHLFVDIDPKTGLKSIQSQLWAVVGKDSKAIISEKKFLESTMGFLWKDAVSGIGQQGVLGKPLKFFETIAGSGIRAGSRVETAASIHAYAAGIRKTLRQMLVPGRAIPLVDDLVDAGMSADVAKHLQYLMLNNNGNVKAVEAIFRAEKATGELRVFESLSWMTQEQRKMFEDFGVLEDFKAKIKGIPTREEAMKVAKEMTQELRAKASRVAGDIQPYRIQSDGIDAPRYTKQMAYVGEHGLTDNQKLIHGARLNANEQAEDAIKSVMDSVVKRAPDEGIDLQKMIDADVNSEFLNTVKDGTYLEQRVSSYDTFLEPFNKEFETIKKLSNSGQSVDIQKSWDKIKDFPHLRKIDLPKGMDVWEYRDFLWDAVYYPTARDYFATTRDVYSMGAKKIFDDFYMPQAIQNGVMSANENFSGFLYIDKTLEKARIFDNSAVIDDVTKFLPNGDTDFSKVKKLVDINDNIKHKKHLFNIINDELRQQFGLSKESNKYLDSLKGTIPSKKTAKVKKLLEEAGYSVDDIANRSLEDMMVEVYETVPVPYKHLGEVPYEEAVRLLNKKAVRDGDEFIELSEDLKKVIGDSVPPKVVPKEDYVIPPETGEFPPNEFRYLSNAQQQGIIDEIEFTMNRGIYKHFDEVIPTLPSGQEEELIKWFAEAEKRSQTMKLTADQVGTELRNFALIDYSQRLNLDTVASLVYPYGFWYSRTLPNWAVRVAQQPGILAAYGKYKNTMSKLHSEQPEWWRYNVNSDELLGLFPDNPLFFNVEQTLNPINGITGVDFDDPDKSTNWFTTVLNDLGKFGPTTHTLLSFVTALALYRDGEFEAASKWSGNLLPQTSAARAIQSIINKGFNLGRITEGSDTEFKFEGFAEKDEFGGTGNKPWNDPLAKWLSGGYTAYEQRQFGRALAAMVEEGIISEAQSIDAASSQKGQIWEAAIERAFNERALGQLAGFAFGVGFKGRSIADQQIDIFYNDFYSLMEQRHNLSGQEFVAGMNKLKDAYPFMDTLLVARKGGWERDAALAYNAFSRLPPGSDLLENIGMDNRLIQKFYESKGQFGGNPVDGIEPWAQSDIDKFMASVLDLTAVLAVPGDATRDEWDTARIQSKNLNDIMTAQFGGVDENGLTIHDKIDTYYSLFDLDEGGDIAKAFMKANPEVEAALTYRDQVIATYPGSELGTYYGGLDRINRYFKSLMYSEAEKRYGEDILDVQAGYYDDNFFTADKKQYLREHPQLKAYWDFTDSVEDEINRRVVELGSKLGDPIGPEIRPDADLTSTGAQDVLEAVQGGQALTAQQWQQEIGQELFEAVARNIIFGEAMSNAVSTAVGRAAGKFDMKKKDLIQLVGISLIEAGVTGGQ